MKTGHISLLDRSFFGVNEMSKAVDFPSSFLKLFILNSASKFGIVRKTDPITKRVVGFKMVYSQAKNGIIIEQDSLAIDSLANLIVAKAGRQVVIPDSFKDGNTYNVYVEYSSSNEEEGLVKILSIDGKTAEMSWDVSGDQPIFSETLRGGTKYPVRILFSKQDGTILQNNKPFTVISVDKTNNKATIVGDESATTENKLKFSVIGSYEPNYVHDTADLYSYDDVSFKVGTTSQGENTYKIGEVKYDSPSGTWVVVKDINDIRTSAEFFSLTNIQPYDFGDRDFLTVGNTLFVQNKINVRTDVTTESITPTSYGQKGDVSIDETNFKICVAPSSWKKITLSDL